MPVTDRLSGRCQAKRAASGAADKVRSGAQPGDGKVLGLNEPPSADRYRQRGDQLGVSAIRSKADVRNTAEA